jgi:hypothetical protein
MTSNSLGQRHALANSDILCGKLMSRTPNADFMSAERKRGTRLSKGPGETTWRTKVDANFLKLFTRVLKPLLTNVPSRGATFGRGMSQPMARQLMEGYIEGLKREFGMPQELQVEHLFGPHALPEMQQNLWTWTGFLFFQERPDTLLQLDAMGDREGSYDFLRLHEKVTALRHLEPTTPPKVDVLHWIAFVLGWKAGLQELHLEELAQCFDEICPLHNAHDPDNLRKQRARAAQAIQKFEEVFYTSATSAQPNDGKEDTPRSQA